MRREFSSPASTPSRLRKPPTVKLVGHARFCFAILRFGVVLLRKHFARSRGERRMNEMPFRSAKRNVNKLVARFNRVIKAARERRQADCGVSRLLSAPFRHLSNSKVASGGWRKQLVSPVIEWTSMFVSRLPLDQFEAIGPRVKYPGYFNKRWANEKFSTLSFPIL